MTRLGVSLIPLIVCAATAGSAQGIRATLPQPFPDTRFSGPSARLAGHTPPQVLNGTAFRIGHYNPEQKLRLVLAIQPPHMAEEEQFLEELQTRGSPSFHQFLTAEEWNARFAPSAEDEQKVVDWAQSQGLTVTFRYAHRLIVDLEAPVAVIEKAFDVTINNYQVGDEVDFSNDRDPALPASLSGIAYSVQGLQNILRMHDSKPGPDEEKGADYAPGPVHALGDSATADGDSTKLPGDLSLNSGPVSNETNNELDPTDIFSSETYNYAGLQALGHCCNPHNDSTGSPPDSSVGIAAFGTFLGSDVAGFHAAYPYLAYNWTAYNIDGTIACGTGTKICPSGETTQDVEWVIATSNSFGSANTTAHVYVYVAANFNWNTFTTMYSQMLNDGHARVFTTSWSNTENYDIAQSTINSQHAIFNSMVGQGWTLIAASGDRGSSDDCQNNIPKPPAAQVDLSAHTSVAYPGSDTDFVSAGGTQLSFSGGDWVGEIGWTGGQGIGSCNANNGGSGGGASVYFPKPSWQSSLGGSFRQTPDLALNALGIGQNDFINGKLNGDANGTSVVAPELAGFFAQENAYLAYIGSICGSKGDSPCEPIGNPNPLLYYEGVHKNAAHDPFYDIKTGCNSNDATTKDKLKFFCAGSGYDQVTGWGAANMLQLAWAINWEAIPANGIPYVSWTGPATHKWYNTNQTVSWTIHDWEPSGGTPGTGIAGETQGWDSIPADPSSEATPGKGNSFYSGPQFVNDSTGCLAFEPNGCSGGVSQGCHTAYARGWNNQGWSTAGVPGYPETYGPLCYDTVAPVTTPSQGAPAGNGSVKLTLSATDAGTSNGTGSGVSKTYYSLDTTACTLSALTKCTVYSSPFTISAAGSHTVRYFSMDVAGNFESEKSLSLTIQ